jgi:hypothetical protein
MQKARRWINSVAINPYGLYGSSFLLATRKKSKEIKVVEEQGK